VAFIPGEGLSLPDFEVEKEKEGRDIERRESSGGGVPKEIDATVCYCQ
jgi:hypothetical protein